VVFHWGGGPGQVGSMVIEVDGIGHGASLMAEELGTVLGGDDPDGVGCKTMAKHLDRHFRQTRSAENDVPWLAQRVEWPSGLSPGHRQVLGAFAPRYRFEQPHGFGSQEDRSPTSLGAVSFGPWDSNAGDAAIEMAPVETGPQQLSAVADPV
jgi:hypothetical protein